MSTRACAALLAGIAPFALLAGCAGYTTEMDLEVRRPADVSLRVGTTTGMVEVLPRGSEDTETHALLGAEQPYVAGHRTKPLRIARVAEGNIVVDDDDDYYFIWKEDFFSTTFSGRGTYRLTRDLTPGTEPLVGDGPDGVRMAIGAYGPQEVHVPKMLATSRDNICTLRLRRVPDDTFGIAGWVVATPLFVVAAVEAGRGPRGDAVAITTTVLAAAAIVGGTLLSSREPPPRMVIDRGPACERPRAP